MHTSLIKLLLKHPTPYLTDTELDNLLQGTPNSRYSKVKRMLARGELLHIRRGLYCLTEELGYQRKPHPFELAQYIYGPSFISLESALSYYQLIPEAVYSITSITSKRSKEFDTPLGMFNYQHAPIKNLYTLVTLIKENERQFFIAKPWRAICDYVFCYRKNWNSLEPLSKSLRLDLDKLPILKNEEIELLDEYYQQTRLTRFLKGIQYDLIKAREKA